MNRRSPDRPQLHFQTGGRIPLPSIESVTMFDWLGWHTIIGIAVGLALPPAIAFATGLFGSGSNFDYSVEAARAAYPDVYRSHYEEVLNETRSRFFVAAVNEDLTKSGPWTDGIRQGWASGAHNAISAMRDALETGGLGESAFEHDVLDQLERTASSRP